jgi:polysaccharide pyruvyl transferase WcaK-like protein
MKHPARRSGVDYHIGVFGHYGHDNMGDEAIIEAVIQNLRMRQPALRITGFSMTPEDTSRRYGIPAHRIRWRDRVSPGDGVAGDPAPAETAPVAGEPRPSGMRERLKRIALLRFLVQAARFLPGLPRVLWREAVFLRDSYRTVRDLDCLLVAGSNQFLDNFGGVWGFPYTLLKWTVFARFAGARVVYLSVGAGPIDSLWSRIMVRGALLLADYVSFRDAGSRRLIRWFGSGKRWRVYPDLAQSLRFDRRPPGDGARPVVGINPMPVYDSRSWCDPDDARYERYVGQLARFASRLLRERYPVFFFGTQPSDEPVIDDVIARLDGDLAATARRMKPSNTVAEAMHVFGSADIVVPTRYHGTILGLHARRPVLGICYYRKTREALEAAGQEAYAVDLDGLDEADLWRRFEALVANRREELHKIGRADEEAGALLAEQYDAVLEMLGAPVVAAAPTAHPDG